MSQMTPTMRARLETFKSIRVAHPRLEEVDRAVRRSIWEHASYTQQTDLWDAGSPELLMKNAGSIFRR
jgi:hypothetical protein